MPIINIKSINRGYVEELARLFEELESRARQLVGTSINSIQSEEEGEAEEGVKLGMFKKLRQAFREIDSKVAEILEMLVNVDEL
jgi:hypothetical protein